MRHGPLIALSRISLNCSAPELQFYTVDKRRKLQALEQHCAVLGVPSNATLEMVRDAFQQQAKIAHPDTPGGDEKHFQQVKEAYDFIMSQKKKNGSPQDQQQGQEESGSSRESGAKEHVRLQHRRYLSHDGHANQKDWDLHRVQHLKQSVDDRNVSALLQSTSPREQQTMALASSVRGAQKAPVFNMVEDAIRRAVARGELSNLPGKGKPLKSLQPGSGEIVLGIDNTTRKVNDLLRGSGFVPDWVERDQTIVQQIQRWRQQWHSVLGGASSRMPAEARAEMEAINRSIRDFNLIVPSFHLQKFPLSWERERRRKIQEDRQASNASMDPARGA
jgi:hypothetical protein